MINPKLRKITKFQAEISLLVLKKLITRLLADYNTPATVPDASLTMALEELDRLERYVAQ